MTEPQRPESNGIDPEAIEGRAWGIYQRMAAQNSHTAPESWANVPEGERQFVMEQALQELLRERDGSLIESSQVAMPSEEQAATVIAKMNDHFGAVGKAVGGMVEAVSSLLIPMSALVDKLKQIEDAEGRGFWMTHGEMETDAWVSEVTSLRDQIDRQL